MYDSESSWLGVDLTETTKKTSSSRKTPTRKRKIPVTINFIDKEFLERIKSLNDLNDAIEMERIFNLSKITKEVSFSRRNSLVSSITPSKPTSEYFSTTKLQSTTQPTSKQTYSTIKNDAATTKKSSSSTTTKKSSAFKSIFITNTQVPLTLSSLTSTISMAFLNSTTSTRPQTTSTTITTSKPSSLSSIHSTNKTSLAVEQGQSLLSTFKEKLVQTTTSALSSTLSTIDAHRGHNHIGGSTSRHDCNTNLTPIQYLNKSPGMNGTGEEYTNIWKLAFFVLAFLVGFISLLLILTFSIRILITKLQRKNKFDYNDYNLQNMRPKSPHISSISLFEFDPDICSASNCGLTPIVNASRRSLGANTLKHNNINKSKHHSINSRATTITTAGFNSMFSQYCRHNQELLHANNPQQIYGISNKAFVEDFYDTTSNFGCTMNRTNVPSSFRPNNLNINSARKSSDQLAKVESNESVNDLKNTHERAKSIEIDMSSVSPARKDDQNGAYQSPWKVCTTNDYEALEPNTATGSLANLSAVTTFSELLSESKNESYPFVKSKELVSTNNNENISRSSKITQELEMKLKERRQIMESKSDKFQPKILSPNEFSSPRNDQTNSTGNMSNVLNANNNQPISIVELDRKLKNWQNEIFNENTKPACKTASTSSNCVCPCHSKQEQDAGLEKHDHKCHNHHHQHQPKHQTQTSPISKEKRSQSRPESRTSETRPTDRQHHRTETSTTCKGKRPKIIIDGSSTLPTKRESIRMLIENKAVTENKQKNALEMHLNTLICSRITNTCTINE